MANGTVKWFNDAKGYGFIEPAEGGEDIFAHFSSVEMDGFRSLKQGSKVSYDLGDGPKGPHALNIQLLEPAPAKPRRTPYGIMDARQAAHPQAEVTGLGGKDPNPA
jgi:cold shock protein